MFYKKMTTSKMNFNEDFVVETSSPWENKEVVRLWQSHRAGTCQTQEVRTGERADVGRKVMIILKTHFVPMFCLGFSSFMIYISVLMLYFSQFCD